MHGNAVRSGKGVAVPERPGTCQRDFRVGVPPTVRVALPLPLARTFTYLVPEALRNEAKVGCRVEVGFRGRRITGVIVEQTSEAGGKLRLRPISDVLDATPLVSGDLLRLTSWMADYYICGWGEVIRAALPSGIDSQVVLAIRRAGEPDSQLKAHPKAGPIFRYLDKHPEATREGMRNAGLDVPMALLRRLESAGLISTDSRARGPKVRPRFKDHLRLVAGSDPEGNVRGPKQKAILAAMAAFAGEGIDAPARRDVLRRADAGSGSVAGLVGKGLIEVVRREVTRLPEFSAGQAAAPVTLHPAQEAAVAHIEEAVGRAEYQTFLLHGVTGSGKTEVYIAALARVLERGQTGIILVPEIALTPQTVRRFRRRFGDRVAVLHSRMSLGERYDAWRHLRQGRYSVAIGPRSAVLAPLANLGLIVVDEEQEASYKQQEPAPRYNARDVAVMRARMQGAVCVLGSATPSLESLSNAHAGKYTLLEMPDRVPVSSRTLASLPDIRIIDLTLEKKKHQLAGAVSAPLREAIRLRVSRGEQVILLQNRRGYAPIMQCGNCGFVPSCPDCSVTLTYHKVRYQLRCHFCGSTHKPLAFCPKCSSPEMQQRGAGTQRVEEELAEVIPESRILRMDLDTTHQKNAHTRLLDAFGRGDADILVGTQMVAKGLDFRRVTLVGVVGADVGMHLPDFRAEERTFQLLMQVAGRAGRAELKGEVMLQTRRPDHPVFQYVLSHDYAGFAKVALQERRTLGYPPFGRLVAMEFRGPDEARVARLARECMEVVKKELPGSVEVLGPGPAYIARIKKQYRYQALMKAPKTESGLSRAVRRALEAFGRPPAGYRVSSNVDPHGLD